LISAAITEAKTPAAALISIRSSGYVALKYILGKLIIVSQKQAMPLMQLSNIISILSPLIVAHTLHIRYCCNSFQCYLQKYIPS